MQLSVLLINQEDFEGYADVSANIDSKYLEPHIRVAQETTLKTILCSDFYTEILSQFEADTLTTENETILPYIQKCLIFYSYVGYLLYAQIRSTPHGFVQKKSDESDQITDKRLGELLNDAREKARFYEGELREFLEDNEDDYATWRDDDCGCSEEGFSGFGITKA
jgi:hypothetical protein